MLYRTLLDLGPRTSPAGWKTVMAAFTCLFVLTVRTVTVLLAAYRPTLHRDCPLNEGPPKPIHHDPAS
jgi:hypothetical protein